MEASFGKNKETNIQAMFVQDGVNMPEVPQSTAKAKLPPLDRRIVSDMNYR